MMRHKLEKLNEDQVAVLLYCLNDGLSASEKEITYDDLKFIQPMYAFQKLNEFAPKIKNEHRQMMQDIVNLAVDQDLPLDAK